MTRQETIQSHYDYLHKEVVYTEQQLKAQAFTEKHKESHKIHLENGYIEASISEITQMTPFFVSPEQRDRKGSYLNKQRIWAIDQNGVFTTEF